MVSIVLDHEDPNTVYLSREHDGAFRIERWITADGGESWTKEVISEASARDNVRPAAVRNAGKGLPLQMLWIRLSEYRHYTDYKGEIRGWQQ
jgi:hypothetical protein